jgi:hypothetical protein
MVHNKLLLAHSKQMNILKKDLVLNSQNCVPELSRLRPVKVAL